ncbi:MAG TPA: GAF domain-containing protein [Rhizomicrobium sp.]|jgi:GAF domain-containing protein
MFEARAIDSSDKPAFYRALAIQLEALLTGETDPIANAANTSALIYHSLPDLNWAGFYFLRGQELLLGPFQGKPACVRIAVGRGVCGAAIEGRKPLLVGDVNAFSDHIACDSASRSELVVPLMNGEEILGVLDLDSPHVSRFDAEDLAGVQKLAEIYVAACEKSGSRGG